MFKVNKLPGNIFRVFRYNSPRCFIRLNYCFGLNVPLNTLYRSYTDRKLGDGGKQCILVGQDSVLKTIRDCHATTNISTSGWARNGTQDLREVGDKCVS